MTTKTRLKKMVCMYLEFEQIDRLNRLARRRSRPKAEMIREAIDAYLKKEEARS